MEGNPYPAVSTRAVAETPFLDKSSLVIHRDGNWILSIDMKFSLQYEYCPSPCYTRSLTT